MQIPIKITPARRPIDDGYEVDYSSRDFIPIRFSHALMAILLIPVVGFVACVIGLLFFSTPS